MKKFLTLSIIVLLFATCKKKDQNSVAPVLTFSPGHGVFVVNQGVYGDGNSSVSYLNLDSVVIHNDIFTSANGVPLGDVAQSMTIVGNNAYVVINNSQRVEYVSCTTFKNMNSINNFASSPRYLLPITSGKAYITNEFSPFNISILNTQSNTISGTIPVKGWTEQMVQSGNNVFVAAPGGYSLYVINSQNDTFLDTITVGDAPTSICVDKNGMIWVYCVGNSYFTSTTPIVNPSLYEIDPSTQGIVKSFNFSSVYAAEGYLCMNKAADSLFFVHQDIYRMAITDAILPATPFISSNSGAINFYGLLKAPDGRILAGDAKNFTESGAIDVYTANGNLINSLNTGAASPSDMVYY